MALGYGRSLYLLAFDHRGSFERDLFVASRPISDKVPARITHDVDGTLVTQDKVLTGWAIAAVTKLRQAGILFAVTSGRPPRDMSMLMEPLQLSTPIAAFNGGLFAHPDSR